MSEVLWTAFLVSASLFLMGALALPDMALWLRARQCAIRFGQRGLRRTLRAAAWLSGADEQPEERTPPTIAPAQVGAAALGLLGGLFLSLLMPIPLPRWLFPLVGGISLYQVPALLLRRKLAVRRRAILRELPEVVSLLRGSPHRNLAGALGAIVRNRRGALATIIKDAMEGNATGVPLLKAVEGASAGLRVEELGRFVEVLSQVQNTSTRRDDLLRSYGQELLSRRRERALRAVETAEGKMSAVLTAATAIQLLLLLVVPSLLRFLGPGQL